MTAPTTSLAHNSIEHQLTLIPVTLDDTHGSERNGTCNTQNGKNEAKTPPPRYFEFLNTHLLWHAPDARSIFGGVPLAQSVAAAQDTVPADFTVHSLQALFIRGGDPALPVRYVVRSIRSSRGSASRVVEGFQQKGSLRPPSDDEVIFTAMLSFVAPNKGNTRPPSPGQRISTYPRHTTALLPNVPLAPTPQDMQLNCVGNDSEAIEVVLASSQSNTSPSTPFHLRRVYYWMRCRAPIAAPAGSPIHGQALAFMSDRVFFGVIQRVHNIRRYTTGEGKGRSMFKDELGMLRTMYTVRECEAEEEIVKGGRRVKMEEVKDDRTIDFLASMSHTMYFHDLEGFRADEWVLLELESPWADKERGLAVQRMYGTDGRLVASCTQEGMIRLSRPGAKI